MGLFHSTKEAPRATNASSVAFDQSDKMTALDKAKLDVRKGKVRLTKWQKYLENETSRLHESAKELMRAGKKEKALAVLKLKKLKISALRQSQDQLLNLENLLLQIEQEEMSIEMVKAVKNGTEALEIVHQVMSVEHVEKLLEDNEEALATVQEIDDLLSNSELPIDMSEVENELTELITETGAEVSKDADAKKLIQKMPEVPFEKPSLSSETSVETVSHTRAPVVAK